MVGFSHARPVCSRVVITSASSLVQSGLSDAKLFSVRGVLILSSVRNDSAKRRHFLDLGKVLF